MAKRTAPATRPGQKQPEWMKHICDDCKHARWVETHQNKDWEGKYICLTCPFEQWHIIRGRQRAQSLNQNQRRGNNDKRRNVGNV